MWINPVVPSIVQYNTASGGTETVARTGKLIVILVLAVGVVLKDIWKLNGET